MRLVSAETFRHRFRPGDAAVGQDVGELLFNLLAQPFETAVADQEFQPRHVLIAPVAVSG